MRGGVGYGELTTAVGSISFTNSAYSTASGPELAPPSQILIIPLMNPIVFPRVCCPLVLFTAAFFFPAHAAEAASSPPSASPASATTNSTASLTALDHRNMMQQLGITKLRPGPSGRRGATNEANYDPAKANPFPD